MTTAIGSYATLAAVKARLSGTFDSTDDALIGTLCDQANQFIESPQGTGRVLAPRPIGSGANEFQYFDGDGGRILWFDVRAVSELAVAPMTGGAYTVLPAADYFLRPLPQDRSAGWPATRIELSDYGTGGYYAFPAGYATVRVKAVTGWPAIPDDIAGLAITMVVRAWHARQSGQTDIVGNDETGAPVISRFLSAQDWLTLKAYRVAPPVA